MASLLFDGSIYVPEQWLVSSPNFCKIAAEITESWMKHQKPGVLPKPGMRRPPIIPVFFSSQIAYGDERFLIALRNRLDENSGSPIRLAPFLNQDAKELFDPNKRTLLYNEINRLLGNSRIDRTTDRYFLENFSEILEDTESSSSFFNLNSYFYLINQDFKQFEQSAYNKALTFRVRAVAENTYSSGESSDLNLDRHKAWRAFFDEARTRPRGRFRAFPDQSVSYPQAAKKFAASAGLKMAAHRSRSAMSPDTDRSASFRR